MQKRFITVVGVAAAIGGAFLAGSLTAQQDKKSGTGAAPAMSPEEQAMMEAWMQAGKKNEHHARLGKMAGKWKASVQSWFAPGAPPNVSEATASIAPIMDGRFMLEQVNGAWGDMPFEGMSIAGYNNLEKRYETVWCDNMGTGLMMYHGQYDSTKDAIVSHTEFLDPMTNKMKKSRTVARWASPDKMVFESFTAGPDGKEFREMEIVYTRQ